MGPTSAPCCPTTTSRLREFSALIRAAFGVSLGAPGRPPLLRLVVGEFFPRARAWREHRDPALTRGVAADLRTVRPTWTRAGRECGRCSSAAGDRLRLPHDHASQRTSVPPGDPSGVLFHRQWSCRAWRGDLKRLCATCHDVDPSRDRPGSFGGPPVTGSSRELLEAKVVGNQYPDGYSPKRPTQFMLPLSGVTPAMLDELAAYLSAQRTPSEPSGN